MTQGRFPSHLLLSHSVQCTQAECVAGCPVRAMDLQSGISKSTDNIRRNNAHIPNAYGSFNNPRVTRGHNDEGGASRFFQSFRPSPEAPRGDLMRYLVRLITPPGGVVLDPFGSHDTARACQDEGFSYIGIEETEAEP